jgi:6-phosphofructokinase
VLGSGECDYALIPEVGFTMKVLCEHMLSVLRGRKRTDSNPYGMIIMSEAAIPRDVDQYVDEPYVGLTDAEKRAIHEFISGKRSDGTHGQPWRVSGQTPDELRTGGLKVVAKVLEHSIRRVAVSSDPSIRDSYWQDFRVLTNEPRHILRSTPPSVSDVIFGQRMGALAVDNAMAGYSDFMVSQWLTEFVLVPLKLVVLGRKRLPPSGIFWKSVLASTQQPVEDLSALTREEAG